MKLVFATNNKNKLKEIRAMAGEGIEIVGLDTLGFKGNIPEDHETLEENALQKAETIANKFNVNCFADDTGLEIEALDGRPGVYSARYAGPQCSPDDNMDKVLSEMAGKNNRRARFRTVIALILDGEKHFFEGEVLGEILESRQGEKGFGYDPIFKPDEYNGSFAEMTLEDKNKISHRGRATRKFVSFLKFMT